MKDIYKTNIMLLKQSYYKYYIKNCFLYNGAYMGLYDEIKEKQLEYILTHNFTIEGLDKSDMIEIRDSNKPFCIPRLLLDETIFVTRNFDNTYGKEIITGKNMYQYWHSFHSNYYPIMIESITNIDAVNSASDSKLLMNYLKNSDIIRNKINLISETCKKIYKEEKIKYKEEKKEKNKEEKLFSQNVKRLLRKK